ncbi:unnamed protein product, partial [Aphanomyces euteiches]
MVTLGCVVVGEGRPFLVDAAENERVGDLKHKIKEILQDFTTCNAHALELYLALKDGSWLGSKSNEIKALKENGQIGNLIKELLQEEELNAVKTIRACFSGENKPPIGPAQIHVLVVAPHPNKKQRTTVCQWNDEKPIIYSLDKGRMYFANRDDAVKQLQKIFQSKYERADGGAGREWVIPLVDHVRGLGKSAFGRHFIQKSRETWPEASKRTPFQKTLCDCRTIFITLTKGELLNDSFEAVMMDLLIRELKRMFQVEPDILSNPPESIYFFLADLTNVVGPLFIVLDGIGNAFSADDLTHLEQRDKFVSFCTNVVGTWQSLAKVFFLLAGRSAFLTYVGRRPDNGFAMYSIFKFERLKLSLLRPNAIVDILKNTMLSNDMSIYAGLGLNDTTALTVAERLFHQTNGHPRTLLEALTKCSSVEDLLDYKEPFPLDDWQKNLERERNG